jgi:hypothetical protein
MLKKCESDIIQVDSKGKFIPDPALKEAFNIFVCGFKLGSLFME